MGREGWGPLPRRPRRGRGGGRGCDLGQEELPPRGRPVPAGGAPRKDLRGHGGLPRNVKGHHGGSVGGRAVARVRDRDLASTTARVRRFPDVNGLEMCATRFSICMQREIVSSDNRSASPRAHRAGGGSGSVSGKGTPERDWLHRPRGGGGGGGCPPRAAHHSHRAIPGVTAVPDGDARLNALARLPPADAVASGADPSADTHLWGRRPAAVDCPAFKRGPSVAGRSGRAGRVAGATHPHSCGVGGRDPPLPTAWKEERRESGAGGAVEWGGDCRSVVFF